MLKLRSVLTAAAFATAAIAGTVAEAKAQDRSLWLYDGQSTNVQGYFVSGEAIYATCDGDCYDLDLFLFDSAGRLVAQDVELDSAPVVFAPYEGNFTIEVSMPNCTHSQGCAAWVASDYGF